MFDSHCHLQDKRISERVDEVISHARAAGVSRMLCCGSEAADWADVARIGEAAGGAVVCAYGIHPWHAGSVDVKGIKNPKEVIVLDIIKALNEIKKTGKTKCDWTIVLIGHLLTDTASVVGEIGLDHTVEPRNDDVQAEVFIHQLDAAKCCFRAVSIHCRNAWGDMMSILKDRGGLPHGGALHSYSGPPDLVGQLEDMGCYISFSGSILIPGNKRAVESLKRVSPGRLLVETDSPDILPSGAAGPHNEPANLPMVINKISEILGEPPEKIAELTHDNAVRLFCR